MGGFLLAEKQKEHSIRGLEVGVRQALQGAAMPGFPVEGREGGAAGPSDRAETETTNREDSLDEYEMSDWYRSPTMPFPIMTIKARPRKAGRDNLQA